MALRTLEMWRPSQAVGDCDHEASSFLGAGGGALYRQCASCGTVLMAQGA